MIVFTTTSNRGGMRRVAESLIDLLENKPSHIKLKAVIFSSRPVECDHPDLHWIPWNEEDQPYSKEHIEHYSNELKKFLPPKVDFIIGDWMTLAYYEYLNARIIYDVHILGKQLFQAMNASNGIYYLDKISKYPVATVIGMQEFRFLKFESRFILKASQYVINSQNSGTYLRHLYKDECGQKPMHYIPVASVLPESNGSHEKTMDVYTFGRFHPQKGLHLLIKENWASHPLYMRGLEEAALTEEGIRLLEKNHITPLPWAWDSVILTKDLLQSKIVIFPAIYEPWGLALQEALSLGCICVAHKNHSGHEEQIEDGINGFLVDMNSPGWITKIDEILSLNDAEKKRISEAAKASSKMSYKSRTDEWIKLLKKITQET